LVPHHAASRPNAQTVAFAVALRQFESQSVALANQAVAQSGSPGVRAAAAQLATDGNVVAARIWQWLDRWDVPGDQRLGVPPSGLVGAGQSPTATLHHACGLVTADELGRLSELEGPAFDQDFARAWVAHADAAFTALESPAAETTGGLRAIVRAADEALRSDVSVLAARWA
jgi:uncharacterized protein (DUF305 family)